MKNWMHIILVFIILPSLSAQISYPARMFADSAHAPFYYGVASGDAMPHRVMIWTHITVDTTQYDSIVVFYEMALDSQFTQVVTSGTQITNDSSDWTVKVDVSGLLPNTTYYYRFFDAQQHYSCIGRTRTAPVGSIARLKFAVISCSSIYSGFFNAYRQIALRDDLNTVIHLGDYVYDFVDENEEVRVPEPYPVPPATLSEWRQLHRYHLLDPDLRHVRQRHPLSIMWDNHDISGADKNAPTRAFLEYTPTRQLDTADYKKIYRVLRFGDLADVILLDMMLPRNVDQLPGGGYSTLGLSQYNWFIQQLGNSTARWKIVGTQKMFSQWAISALEAVLGTPGGVLNTKAWDGFPEERMYILDFIESNHINNVLFISGDSHVSVAADVAKYPTDTTRYHHATGWGSLAAEFLPTSVSRGNFDEQGFPVSVIPQVIELSMQENPHQQYLELTKHGYGILDINADSIRAQYWYCDILSVTNQQELGKEMVILNNENHWKRTSSGTFVKDLVKREYQLSEVYPNPAEDAICFDIYTYSARPLDMIIKIFSFPTLQVCVENALLLPATDVVHPIRISLPSLPSGLYLLFVQGQYSRETKIFFKL